MSEQMEALEKMRKSCRVRWYLGLVVGVAGMALGTALGFSMWEEINHLVINILQVILAAGVIGFFGLCLGWGIFYNSKYKRFNAAYKEQIVKGVLESVFDDLVYEPEKGLSKEAVANTGMVAMGNVFKSDDYLWGRYRNVPLYQADVLIKQVVSRGRNGRDEATYFDGKWMIFDLQQKTGGYVHIRGKEFMGAAKGSGVRYPEVGTGDAEFDRFFNVYASDPQLVEQLVTPQFMESLRLLREENEKRQLLICFQNGVLHIAMDSCWNSLDAPVFQAIDEQAAELAAADVRQITGFIDALGLARETADNRW